MKNYNRRRFMREAGIAGLALGLTQWANPAFSNAVAAESGRIGIIGLDTSHSIAFTKAINAADAAEKYKGFRIVAAYPRGSADIESSTKRIAATISAKGDGN
jgi:methylmalonyl-CoA mutase cobalamin-binding subunit